MQFKEIAERLGVSERSVSRVLVENGINTKLKRRYIIRNENYFEYIDTEFKAYILGFIYADGFVGLHDDFCISLTDKHEDNYNVLNKLKQELGTDLEITHGYDKTGNGHYTFKFSNKKIVNDLNKCGVYTCKSLNMEDIPHNIDPELFNHFIRGYFDGDGTILTYFDSYDKRQRYVLEMLGTENYLNKIQDIMCKNCDIRKTKLKENRVKGLFSICYKGINGLLKIRDFLYKDATYYLTYKHDRFYNIQPL